MNKHLYNTSVYSELFFNFFILLFWVFLMRLQSKLVIAIIAYILKYRVS